MMIDSQMTGRGTLTVDAGLEEEQVVDVDQ